MKKKLILLAALSMMISCTDKDDITFRCPKEIVSIDVTKNGVKTLINPSTNLPYIVPSYDYILTIKDNNTGKTTQVAEYDKRELPELNECY